MGEEPKIIREREARAILAELEERCGDFEGFWAAFADAPSYAEGLLKLRERVDPEKPYFVGRLNNGIRFVGDARDYASVLHALDPATNATLIQEMIALLGDRAGAVVDAGANIGVVTASLARHIAGRGHVYAFEPAPETCRLAAGTLALNNLDNVTLVEAALSDIDHRAAFQTTPGNSAIASAFRHSFDMANEWKEVVVQYIKLDTFFSAQENLPLSLIKIDVEGHELRVIRGAERAIRASAPAVIYEYTPTMAVEYGWSDQDSIDLLNALRPFVFDAVLEDGTGVHHPFPLPGDLALQVNVFAVPRVAGQDL